MSIVSLLLLLLSTARMSTSFAPFAARVYRSPRLSALSAPEKPKKKNRTNADSAAQMPSPTSSELLDLVAESCGMTFVPVSDMERAGGWAAAAAACAFVGAADVAPPQLRMLVASVLIFANFEYVFHRWIMHSDNPEFAEYQQLHVAHHVETNRDMTLEAGGDSDPRHIYFSEATTFASVAISTLGLGVLNGVFNLNFGSSPVEAAVDCTATSALVALFHTAHWQTIHGDIHEYYTEPSSGMPRVDALSAENIYTRWVVQNHVGHHVLRGTGNYNIVFPGPDYLWGSAHVNAKKVGVGG
jgi:hypothetical protein